MYLQKFSTEFNNGIKTELEFSVAEHTKIVVQQKIFSEKKWIDVRKWYQRKDGSFFPSKVRGICMTVEDFLKIIPVVEKIKAENKTIFDGVERVCT